MKKRGGIFLIFFLLSRFLSAQSNQPDHTITTIDSEEIINSVSIRNDYIFSLMNNWDRITADGYNWQVSANGLSSFQQQNWLVYVDGQRMDINFLNSKNINNLPVLISHIDSVEVISSPKIINGEYSSDGMLHIHSTKPKSGFSLHTRVATGNPTGDPGPYLFTETETENVEEDGPEISLSVEYGSDELFGRVLLFTETFAATDAAIMTRTVNIPYDSLKIRRFMPSLQLGTNALNGTHNLFVGYSTSEEQFFYPEKHESNNLFYIPEAVTDYSAHSIFKHAGLSGFFNMPESIELHYQLKASGNQVYNPNSSDSNYIDQRSNNYLANAELVFNGIKIGSGFEHTLLTANYSPVETGIDLFKLYGDLNLKAGGLFDFGFNVFFVSGNSDAGIKTSLLSRWKPENNFIASLNIAYVERIPNEESGIWFYINNGYDLLSILNVDYSIDGEINKSKKITADLNLSYNFSAQYEFSAGIIYRNFITNALEFVTAEYLPDEPGFNTSTVLNTNSSGEVAGVSINFKNIISRTMYHEIFYRYQTAISGDDFFRNEWETIPDHKLIYKFSFEPFQSFSIWTKLTFLSSAYWNGFTDLAELSDGFYNEEIKPSLVFDLAFRKSLWENRLRFGLLFRNVLNNEVRYHPVGPNFPLSVYIQAELAFSSFYEI